MIRPATLADVEVIFDIAVSETVLYSKLLVDRQKIRRGITQAISSAKHFAWVSEDNDEVSGALIGLTSDNLWAQRCNCIIALWQADVPGEGVRLLRKFKEWVQGRRVIRVAGLVPDSNHIDWRAYAIAERMGFKRNGSVFLLYN